MSAVRKILILLALPSISLLALTPPLTSWTSTDLGSPTTAGSASHDTNTGLTTLQSEGTGFGGTSDDGFFLHGTLNVGDTLTAQLNAAPSGALGNEQAGLVVRTGLNQDAASLFLSVTADGTVSALWRPADSAAAKIITLPQVSATDWLQLVADADSVTAYFSTDGLTFTPLFAVDLPLSDPVYGGLAVASGDAGQTATAVFAEADLGPTAFRVDVTLDAAAATATGTWNTRTTSAGEYLLNDDYLDDLGLTSGTAELEFTPTIPLTGSYEVYARWSSGPDRDTAVPVDITDANSQVTALALDQTASDGEWVYLGSYDFDSTASGQSINITNTGTTGLVTLDAIKLIGSSWTDTDADNLPDPWESTFFGNLTTANATSNGDSDGLTDLEELFFGTDPTLADTDGDWIDDDIEANNGLDPLNATHAGLDSDGDGWSDYEESVAGTDPLDLNNFPSGATWSNVNWTDLADTATTDLPGVGSTLTKTTTSGSWNADAVSTLFLQDDGEVRFGFDATDFAAMIGFNDGNGSRYFSELNYAVYVNNGNAAVYENGASKGSLGTYETGDLFSIERVGTEVRILKNGTLLYTSTTPSSGNLVLDTSLASTHTAISRAQQRGFIPETSLLTFDNDGDELPTGWELDNNLDPYDASDAGLDPDGDGWNSYQEWIEGTDPQDEFDLPSGIPFTNVVWTDLVNTMATDVPGVGSTLSKDSTSSSWNADAVSTLFLGGDGEVRFGFADTNFASMVGLNDGNTNRSYAELDYAIYTSGGSAIVYENGASKANLGAFTTSDLFTIERAGSQIHYKKNGTIEYTSMTPSLGPLVLDTSLASPSSWIKRVQQRGFIPESSLLTFDNDGDEIPTGWEVDNQLDPNDPNDAALDPDGDGWNSYQEWIAGTDPQDINSVPTGTPFSNVIWIDLVDTATTDVPGIGSTLTKTGTASSWNADGVSTLFLESDGEVRFAFDDTNFAAMIGLNDGNTNRSYAELDYAIYVTGGAAIAYENGSSVGSLGAYSTNDLFSIERVGTTVHFKKNGTIEYTSTTPSSGDLVLDTSFATPGGKIVRVQQQGFISETSLMSYDNDGDEIPTGWELTFGLDPYDPSDAALDGDGDGWNNYQEWLEGTDPTDPNDFPAGTPFSNVVWTDLINTVTTDVAGIGSTLAKNTTSSSWNADAVSTLYLDGDGEFRFGFDDTDFAAMIGFNDANNNRSYLELDYAIYVNGGAAVVYENGSSKGSLGAYSTSDLFSIERVGSEIRYKKNGVVVYTSLTPSSGNLVIDTSLASPNALINRVQQRGFYDPNAFIDSDGDGMPDTWETTNGFDPSDPADGSLDADGDGLSNVDEYLAGTDPSNRDSDGDSFSDYLETQVGSDPLTPEVINDTLGELGPTGLTIFSPVLNFVAE